MLLVLAPLAARSVPPFASASLARPRDIGEVKLDPAFHKLHREIWEALKDEVMKGYQQTGGG